MEPLPREGACQEGSLGHLLLQTEMMRNPEFRMGAIGGHPYETRSDESLQGFVSPVERRSNQRQAVQSLLKIARDNNGDSSSRDIGFNNEDHTDAQSPLA